MPEVPATELSAGDVIVLPDPPGEWRIDVIHSRRDDGVVISAYRSPHFSTVGDKPDLDRIEVYLVTGTVQRIGTWVD